jgi:hypothetical protein
MMTDHRIFYRRHLPHWQPDGATLFITFRLAGSLPRAVIAALQEKREQEERALASVMRRSARSKYTWVRGVHLDGGMQHWIFQAVVRAG